MSSRALACSRRLAARFTFVFAEVVLASEGRLDSGSTLAIRGVLSAYVVVYFDIALPVKAGVDHGCPEGSLVEADSLFLFQFPAHSVTF